MHSKRVSAMLLAARPSCLFCSTSGTIWHMWPCPQGIYVMDKIHISHMSLEL